MRYAGGGAEYRDDGEGARQADGCAGEGLVLERFARAWHAAANGATAARRARDASSRLLGAVKSCRTGAANDEARIWRERGRAAGRA